MGRAVVHFEIPADDPKRMRTFYESLFGWRFFDIPEMGYTTIHTVDTDDEGMLREPGINGRMYKRTESAQVPLNYISVEDVDDLIARAVSGGGKVRAPKMRVPNVGDIAVIEDPEGNPLGIIRPEM